MFIYKRLLAKHMPLYGLQGIASNNTVHRVTGSQILKIRARQFGKRCKGEKSNAQAKITGRGLPRPQYDYKKLVNNLDYAKQNIRNRKCPGNPELVKDMHLEYRQKVNELEALRNKRNTLSKQNKGGDGESIDAARKAGKQLKKDLKELTQITESLYAKMQDEMAQIPNDTHPLSPIGCESEATIVKEFGNKTDPGNNGSMDHVQICDKHELLDFDAGVRVAGSKFLFFKNDAVLLELALVNWAMQELSSKHSAILSKLEISDSYTPVITPDVALTDIVRRCGFVPREQEDQDEDAPSHIYTIKNTDLSLIGTSEIPIAGSKAGLNLDPDTLPLKMVGFSHCFRAEAGASGLLNKGLYRMHQFSKVEMFSFCKQRDSDDVLKEIVDIQVELMSQLGLHGRVLDMPTEELGAAAYRKFDVEVYMPGRQEYGEVCSASNCTDYQSRRLGVRSGKDGFVHTVNGTAIAVPRVILAILETHVNSAGEVEIPKVLQPYLGKEKIALEI